MAMGMKTSLSNEPRLRQTASRAVAAVSSSSRIFRFLVRASVLRVLEPVTSLNFGLVAPSSSRASLMDSETTIATQPQVRD